MPKSESTVMVATVATVATDNLAYGVAVGPLTATVLFARRVAHPDEDTRVYAVRGELFFASSNDLVYQFDYVGGPGNVIIDMSDAHIWDASTVATLDAVTTKYAAKGKAVTIIGMNDNTTEMSPACWQSAA